VRFLGNRSSGMQGWALARVAAARGAEVVLVAANVEVPAPFGVRVVRVESAEELRTAMHAESSGESAGAGGRPADVVVMAAAVADFRPAAVAGTKLKKGGAGEPTAVELVRNPDVLVELVAARPAGQCVVGFAAETGDAEGDVLTHARAKLARKGVDLLVVNDVSAGRVFGRADNEVTVLTADGTVTPVPAGRKDAVAAGIWDAVAAVLPLRNRPAGPSRAAAPNSCRWTPVTSTARATHQPDANACGSRPQGVPSATPSLHLRVGDRGPSRQDRRPDQRLDPGRDARAGPP
jgi:phosphopantothenoylcysteine decarboxylase/phosphopantothenate--cysteine ligase